MTDSCELWSNRKVILDEACTGREDLTALRIPMGVEEIGEGAFAICDNLVEVSLPSSLRIIRGGAFMHCASLREICIPASVSEIGDLAFFGCTALRSAWVSNPACRIGSYAFGGFFPDPEEPEALELYGGSGASALQTGHFPMHFPPCAEAPEKLMYALLWCEEGEQQPYPEAEAFLKSEADTVFHYILRTRRKDLLEALLKSNRIPSERFPAFIRAANEAEQTDFAALLLHSAAHAHHTPDFNEEFSL